MGTQELFASQIYRAPLLKPGSALHRHLVKEASQIETADDAGEAWSKDHYPNGYTSYGSWDQMHLVSPYFQELKLKIDQHVRRYIKELAFDINPKEVQLTRIWVNVMKQNTIHTMHIHPLSVVSGTVYIQVPPGASGIKFEDPRLPGFMGRPPVKAQKKSAASFVTVHPKVGDVVLFESWMRHEVPLHLVKTPRISISFNYDWIRS